jgi:hypothetical protein
MDKFTVTGITAEGTSLFMHIDAKSALHADSVLRAIGISSPFLLLAGHVEAADGRKATTLVEYLRRTSIFGAEQGPVLREYMAWYNHPARTFSAEISPAQNAAIRELGQAAGLANTRLLKEGSQFTVLYTANPNTRFQTDRILCRLQTCGYAWQLCMYRPKDCLEQHAASEYGFRVISEHASPEQAVAALLNTEVTEQGAQRQAA